MNMPHQDRFHICLPYILREEMVVPADWTNPRNFSIDPVPTFGGIVQREYDHYRKTPSLHTQPVKLSTPEEAAWIYENWYWLPHCPNIPKGLDLSFFDSAVNEGSTEAIRILQVALRVESDGIWCPGTTAAVDSTPAAAVVKHFAERRRMVYHETKGFNLYGSDWLQRTGRIEHASLVMIEGVSV